MEKTRQCLDACAEGNIDLVTSLLDGGLDVDACDDDDVTALQVAAANGHEHIVRLLLIRGATVDKSNSAGWTPLLQAAHYGHAAVAALLVQNHANVNARTCYGAGAANLAARSGNLATCRLLEGAGISFSAPDLIITCNGSMLEWSPLMVAAHRGHDSIVKHLLAIGDTNYQTPSLGVSALLMAAVSGHVSTARLLVERGKANVDAVDINQSCALDYSISRNKRQLQEYLESKTTQQPRLLAEETSPEIIEAVKQGDVKRVEAILDQDPSQCNACLAHDGATPLMFAAIFGHLAIAELLVKAGCNVNQQDAVSGWTALMQATFHGRKDVASFLINAGADVSVSAKTGCSVFDMATVLEDVDTELYRLIASRAMPCGQSGHPVKKPNVKSNVVQSSIASPSETSADNNSDYQKTGLKAWWSRISNRFHNLKSDRLPPKYSQQEESRHDSTLRKEDGTANPADNVIIKSLSANPLTAMADVGTGHYHINGTSKTDSAFGSTNLFTTGINSTLKPIVPPLFPPPSFQTDSGTKMPPVGLRKCISGAGSMPTLLMTRPVNVNAKLLQSAHSQLNLVNRIASPPPRVQFANRPAVKLSKQIDVSPSASCDAATLGSSGGAAAVVRSSKILSSASSSTLTAGSDNNNKVVPDVKHSSSSKRHLGSGPQMTHPHKLKSLIKVQDTSVRSLSVVDGASTVTPASSNVSVLQRNLLETNLTSNSVVDDQDDLSGILHKLSLEHYQPIFEEQEVDMEAFLTLNDCDLKELGIPNAESRRQILAAISELNASKDRERQYCQKVLANFNDTLRTRRSCVDGQSVGSKDSELMSSLDSNQGSILEQQKQTSC